MKFNKNFVFGALCCFLYLGFIPKISAQEEYFGLRGSAFQAWNSANFRPSAPLFATRPAVFSSAVSLGVAGEIFYERPLSGTLSVGVSADFSTWNADFSALQPTVFLTKQGVFVSGIIEHHADFSFHALGFAPRLRYGIGHLDFLFSVPIKIGIKAAFRQSERIVSPDSIEFISGSPEQILAEGNIPKTPFQIGLSAGTRYRIPLGETGFSLAPEISFSAPITNFWQEGNLNISTLSGGISLMFTPNRTKAKQIFRDTVRFRDTVSRAVTSGSERVVLDSSRMAFERFDKADSVLERTIIREFYARLIPDVKPLLTAGISTIFVLENGQESNAAKVTMEEFIVNKHIPLLNYIFFEENSAEIPKRYALIARGNAEKFEANALYSRPALEVYRHALNIAGKRLAEKPLATLILTGCNSGAGNEKNNQELARKRAENIRTYLAETWDIAAERIFIQARNLPEKPSAPADPDGIEENRRVEIAVSDASIFAPVILTDTLRTVDPPSIRFRLRAFSEAGVRSWRLVISQRGAVLREFTGEGKNPATIDWAISGEDARPLADAPIDYALDISDSIGQTFSTPKGSIKFEQITLRNKQEDRRGDKIIDRFSLILFDFDSAQLSDRHANVLEAIRKRVLEKSQVRIIGSTDRLGDERHNKMLSEQRANAVSEAIPIGIRSISGIGEDETTYPNSTPEGRFYSRTVRVIVETERE